MLLPHVDAAQAELAGLGEDVHREVLLGVPVEGVRGDALLGEVADGVDQGLLVVGDGEHGFVLLGLGPAGRAVHDGVVRG